MADPGCNSHAPPSGSRDPSNVPGHGPPGLNGSSSMGLHLETGGGLRAGLHLPLQLPIVLLQLRVVRLCPLMLLCQVQHLQHTLVVESSHMSRRGTLDFLG